ncbi:hypothetical protein L7F22_030492 [Adiantum nelumboides]|nr:hypothetical protein [Adiantum nelumboides]
MSAVLAKPQVKDFLKTLAKGKEKGQEQRKEHDVNAHAVTAEGEPSKKPWEEDIPELSSPSYSPPTSFSYSSDSSSSSNPRRRNCGALTMEIAEQASKCQERATQVASKGDWRRVLKSVFYQGSLFPFLANILLFSVAPDWLACFSSAEQSHLFDAFFMQAPATLIVTELVSALAPTHGGIKCDFAIETTLSCKAIERLLTVYLFENNGIKKIVMEFAQQSKSEGLSSRTDQSIVVLAQVVASIPDKARRDAPASLLSPQFHLSATLSALQAAEDHWLSNLGRSEIFKRPLVFTAELIARFCRCCCVTDSVECTQ